MTQENKELLLQDLCARLNTNLVCSINRTDDQGIGYRDETLHGYCNGDIWYEFYFGEDCGIGMDNVSKIKPYLFPLSSMTSKQKAELSMLVVGVEDIFKAFLIEVEFYHKHHFDYRGLIEKSLALDATNLNIY